MNEGPALLTDDHSGKSQYPCDQWNVARFHGKTATLKICRSYQLTGKRFRRTPSPQRFILLMTLRINTLAQALKKDGE